MGPLDASACAWNEPGNQAARKKERKIKIRSWKKWEKRTKNCESEQKNRRELLHPVLDLRGGLGTEGTLVGVPGLHALERCWPGRESILAFIAVLSPRAALREFSSSFDRHGLPAAFGSLKKNGSLERLSVASGAAVGCGCYLRWRSRNPQTR